MIHKINHIALVVEDLETSLVFWRDALGLQLERTESNPAEEAELGFLKLGDSEIELVQPTNPDSGTGKFLAKRGAGFHHICLEVQDLEASMAHLCGHEIQLINEEARTRDDGIRYCFIHPRSTGGVLIELYELPKA